LPIEGIGLGNPLQGYWTRLPQDRFSRLNAELDSGRLMLDPLSWQDRPRCSVRMAEG
jgi:hypothetical protein